MRGGSRQADVEVLTVSEHQKLLTVQQLHISMLTDSFFMKTDTELTYTITMTATEHRQQSDIMSLTAQPTDSL